MDQTRQMRHYLKQIKKLLPSDYAGRKEMLAAIRQRIRDYLEDHPNMKKFLSALLMLTLLLTAAPTTAFADEAPVQQVTTDICHIDDLVIETVLTVYDTPVQMRAVQHTSASKVVTAKNQNGKIVATFMLYGTFEYDGKSAACTSAGYSTSVSDSTWSFTSAKAWASANKSYGSYTLIRSTNGQTVSGNVVITCSPTGTIS